MDVLKERQVGCEVPQVGREVYLPGGCFGVTQERTCSQSDEAHEMGKAQMKVGAEERRPWDSSCDPITS